MTTEEIKKSIADFTNQVNELRKSVDEHIGKSHASTSDAKPDAETNQQDNTNHDFANRIASIEEALKNISSELTKSHEQKNDDAAEQKNDDAAEVKKSAEEDKGEMTLDDEEAQINQSISSFAARKGIDLDNAEVTFVIKEKRKSVIPDDNNMDGKNITDDEVEDTPKNGLTKAFSKAIFGSN